MKKNVGIKMAIAAASTFSVISATSFATPPGTIPASKLIVASTKYNSCKGAPKKGQERCFGIVKKGMNSCRTEYHACAGLAKKNSGSHEWIDVPKGMCKKIVGGSLIDPSESKS